MFALNSELCACSLFMLYHMQLYTHISSVFAHNAVWGSYCGSNFIIFFIPIFLHHSFHHSQPSPSQQINLGPSSNPSAKPSDFHFLKVIGKGSFGKVLLARHRADDEFYAVKVLQKKAILKKKEVNAHADTHKSTHNTQMCLLVNLSNPCSLFSSGETHHVREECASKECQAPVLGGPALLFSNSGQIILHLGLHQWRRGELLAERLLEKEREWERKMTEEKGEAELFEEGEQLIDGYSWRKKWNETVDKL